MPLSDFGVVCSLWECLTLASHKISVPCNKKGERVW